MRVVTLSPERHKRETVAAIPCLGRRPVAEYRVEIILLLDISISDFVSQPSKKPINATFSTAFHVMCHNCYKEIGLRDILMANEKHLSILRDTYTKRLFERKLCNVRH